MKQIRAALLLLVPLAFLSCLQKGDVAVQQGSTLFQQKRFAEAAQYFELALTEECSYAQDTLYIMIANCHSQQGDYDAALDWRQKALAVDGHDAENMLNIGFIYRLKKDDAAAEEWFRLAVQEDPRNVAALANLGALYLTQERIAEAIDCLERADDVDNRSGIIHADLAVCYAKQGRFEEAEAEYAQAVTYKADNIAQFRAQLDALEQAEQQ